MSYYYDCHDDKEQNKENECNCKNRNEQPICCKKVVEETFCYYPQPWDRKEEDEKDKNGGGYKDGCIEKKCKDEGKEDKKYEKPKKNCKEINLIWCEKHGNNNHKNDNNCDDMHDSDKEKFDREDDRYNKYESYKKENNCQEKDRNCGCKRQRCNCCICNFIRGFRF